MENFIYIYIERERERERENGKLINLNIELNMILCTNQTNATVEQKLASIFTYMRKIFLS